MPVGVVQLLVMLVEAAAKFGPGLIEAGANLVKAIETHPELTPEQKAELVTRVKATTANVAAVEPRDV